MKSHHNSLIALILAAGLLASLNVQSQPAAPQVMYNQVGYLSKAPKVLLVSKEVEQVKFLDSKGREVLSVTPATPQYWDQSGESVRKVDFSALSAPGKYTVLLSGQQQSAIVIAEKPLTTVCQAAIRALYINRTAMPILPRYGGKWARPAGHPDTIVYVHASAAGPGRPEGTAISSPLGWYDAGDYNKYIVNSAITTYTLFKALEDYPAYFKKLAVGLPESGKGAPDILSEAMYNYRWMLTMQDPNDGGVYHKLTNKVFDPIVMPDKAMKERYVVMKSTPATLDFAATAAHAAQVLKQYRNLYPGLAEESLSKAEKAWRWALQHPDVLYKQPDDIKTGAYGDRDVKDEWFWAASELYLATGKQEYADAIVSYYQKPFTPEWAIVHGLGFMSLLSHYDQLPGAVRNTGLKKDLTDFADKLVELSRTAPYGVSIQTFKWGSNSYVANEGILKLFAYQLTGDKKYYHSALADMDYILGRNATGYCFVTGFGDRKVMNIHHRPSQADGIPEPVPGFLSGGPNVATFADCPPETPRSKFPAASFVDQDCSYSTNEIAINWNAPLVYLAGGLEAAKKR